MKGNNVEKCRLNPDGKDEECSCKVYDRKGRIICDITGEEIKELEKSPIYRLQLYNFNVVKLRNFENTAR